MEKYGEGGGAGHETAQIEINLTFIAIFPNESYYVF